MTTLRASASRALGRFRSLCPSAPQKWAVSSGFVPGHRPLARPPKLSVRRDRRQKANTESDQLEDREDGGCRQGFTPRRARSPTRAD